jgi:hypothetical protein
MRARFSRIIPGGFGAGWINAGKAFQRMGTGPWVISGAA